MIVNSNNLQSILLKLDQNGGRITTNEVNKLGVHRQFLKQLVDSGKLVQTGRGIYQSPEIMDDELFDIQSEYGTGVFSFETALYLHKLLERAPFEWTMTFKGKYHSEKLKKRGVQVRLSTPELFDCGIQQVMTPANHQVKAYCVERTLCEIVKPRASTDIQVITFAFKEYTKRTDKNLPLLMECAKKFKVEEKVRSYIEVLV